MIPECYITFFKEYCLINISCDIEYGVPPGSVLGPLLFLIYIHDLVNSTTLGEFVLFADDTNIFVTGKDEKI